MGDASGAGTGATELRPAPPSSVDPSGILARPTDDVDRGGAEISVPLVVAQETDAPAEIPPPSNGAPADCAELLEPEQPAFPGTEPAPGRGEAGLVPDVAISVAPSGIPTGGTVEPDPRLSGDVAPMPGGGGTPVVIAWARAGLPHAHSVPANKDVQKKNLTTRSNPSAPEKLILVDGRGPGMCSSPDTPRIER